MGSLLSRFRKKPTTEEQLKKIEESLRKIEDYKRTTERKHKRLIANIILYSAAFYILACVIVFVWYLPESWMIRLVLLIPLVLVPVIVYLLKRLISRFFDSRMVKANEQYGDLQRKKKDIIDSVMETETFNKAKEILSKYAPEKLHKKEQLQISQPSGVPANAVPSTTDLRKRNTGGNPPAQTRPESITSLAIVPRRDLSPTLPDTAIIRVLVGCMKKRRFLVLVAGMLRQQQLPQPMFPKERGVTDKLIEFMIGDGPGYRYALICCHCRGHNGMALKEEFPYLAFNCCYCYQYNPARSKRPLPPKLPETKNLPSIGYPALPAPIRQLEIPPLPDDIIQKEIPMKAPIRQLETPPLPDDIIQKEIPMKEGDSHAESSEDTAEGVALPESDSMSEQQTDVRPEDETSIEKSSDEGVLEFLESDLEILNKANPGASEPQEQRLEKQDDKSNLDSENEPMDEEKSDDDFQNLGFSESDLEFLRKVDPQPNEPEAERQEESCTSK